MMDEYHGPERRSGYVSINTVRTVVREELDAAAKDGRLLSDTDKHDVREWLTERKHRRMMRERLVSNTLGWLVIVVIGGVGLAVWEYIKSKVHQP